MKFTNIISLSLALLTFTGAAQAQMIEQEQQFEVRQQLTNNMHLLQNELKQQLSVDIKQSIRQQADTVKAALLGV